MKLPVLRPINTIKGTKFYRRGVQNVKKLVGLERHPEGLPNDADSSNTLDGVQFGQYIVGEITRDFYHRVGVVALGLVEQIFNVDAKLGQRTPKSGTELPAHFRA